MQWAVIDVQGFNVPEFMVKELTIFDGDTTVHHTFKPSKGYQSLDETSKKSVRFLEQHHHMLKYNSNGTEKLQNLENILLKFLFEKKIDVIYVKGKVKEEFLRKTLGEVCPKIIDLDNNQYAPKLDKEIPLCNMHSNNRFSEHKKCICSLNNAKKLYEFLYQFIP